MRAVTFTTFGDPEVLSVADVPMPQAGEGQVRVRVTAAAVHPVDLVARSGYMGPLVPAGPRYVLGADVAGVVDETGPGVTGLARGDAVIGMSNWPDTKNGTQAEFAVLPASVLARAPRSASAAASATLPLNGHTAAQALRLLGLGAGQTVAITGAAGGVGAFAVELARARGLRVIAISAAEDKKFLTGLGAEFVARSADTAAAVRAIVPSGVDGLLDAASVGFTAMGAVRDGGVFVAVTPPTPPPSERDIRIELVLARADGAELAELAGLVDQGLLTLRVAKTVPLESVDQAHLTLAKGGVRGGLVLVPADEEGNR